MTEKKFQSLMGKSFAFLLVLFELAGCEQTKTVPMKSPSLSPQRMNHLLVATSDFHSGVLVEIDITGSETERFEIPIHSDAVVRSLANSPFFFVVNRLGADNIQWGRRDSRKILGQFSVGRGSNPQDIAIVNLNSAYVTRLESKTLLKVDPQNGQFLKEIDLFNGADSKTISSSDPDGVPEMTWMRLVGDKLLILLQRLNTQEGYEPSNKSQMAVLDTNTDSVDQIITLEGTNPVTEIKAVGDQFVIGEAGKLGVLDGGVEVFDSSFKSLGWVTTERSLGGDLIDCTLLSKDVGVAIIAKDIFGSEPTTQLVAFRTVDGKVIAVLKATESQNLQQILVDESRQLFYLSDRDPRHPGIYVYDTKTLMPLADIYDVGLPPYHMVMAE